MMHTLSDVLRATTEDYLAGIKQQGVIPPPNQIEEDVLENLKNNIDLENALRPKNNQLRYPNVLSPVQIAMIMAALYPICTIQTGGTGSDRSYDLLAMYMDHGPDEGIYVSDDEAFRSVMYQYNFTLRINDFKETIAALRNLVPRRKRCMDPNLIAVNNGIYDYDTKQLLPFTPERIFLSKSGVDYVDNAPNPVIHNPDDNTDWDVESWMETLSDDPEIVNLLWEILGAIIRPLVPWNKMAWFYSEKGNNGKGTLCELMRQLCGENSYAAIKLSEMSKNFALEPLIHASAIITDENDVGTFIDKAANLKSIVTNDAIQIDRKFKVPIAYKFFGFMVQCLNEMPRVKDKSDSFYRRQLFVPFEKCFTGVERKYIKRDYLTRPEVLQYVLWRVLNMNYYSLSEPEACRAALNEYKECNDPVRQFAEEMLPQMQWDIAPFTMLYEAYKCWFRQNMPSGTIQNRKSFINDIVSYAQTDSEWECPDKSKQHRPGRYMDCYEPLVAIYGLKEWANEECVKKPADHTPEELYTPEPGQFKKLRVRGLTRRGVFKDTRDDDAVAQEQDTGDDCPITAGT